MKNRLIYNYNRTIYWNIPLNPDLETFEQEYRIYQGCENTGPFRIGHYSLKDILETNGHIELLQYDP